MPAARAASGNRLVAVIPGMVFTSSRYTSPSGVTIVSARDMPRQPRATWASSDEPRALGAAASGDTRAGMMCRLMPGTYFDS